MDPTVEEVIRKVQKTSWWLIRTFRNWSPTFWKFLWQNYLGPQYEYCGPLYYPSTYKDIDAPEVGLRSWLKQLPLF